MASAPWCWTSRSKEGRRKVPPRSPNTNPPSARRAPKAGPEIEIHFGHLSPNLQEGTRWPSALWCWTSRGPRADAGRAPRPGATFPKARNSLSRVRPPRPRPRPPPAAPPARARHRSSRGQGDGSRRGSAWGPGGAPGASSRRPAARRCWHPSLPALAQRGSPVVLRGPGERREGGRVRPWSSSTGEQVEPQQPWGGPRRRGAPEGPFVGLWSPPGCSGRLDRPSAALSPGGPRGRVRPWSSSSTEGAGRTAAVGSGDRAKGGLRLDGAPRAGAPAVVWRGSGWTSVSLVGLWTVAARRSLSKAVCSCCCCFEGSRSRTVGPVVGLDGGEQALGQLGLGPGGGDAVRVCGRGPSGP